MDDIDSIFDSSLNLEATLVKEGYEEGYNHGLTAGTEDGRQVGLKTGFEVGGELGFYQGCVDVWKSAIKIDPTRFSARVQKNIQRIGDLLDKYPVMDPENGAVQEIMDALRLEFRLVRAALGVNLEYDGYPKSNDLEF